MSETIDDLSVAFSEDGIETVRELDKHVLTKGAWTTIMYRYQDFNKTSQTYGPCKYTIRRYQKRNDQYWLKSKFNISSNDQAQKMIEVLTQWLELPVANN